MATKSASYILSGVTLENLQKMAKQERVAIDEDEKKSKYVEALTLLVEDAGIKQVTSLLTQTQLEEICTPLDFDHEKDGNNPHSKSVLRKRLAEKMADLGVEEFLNRHVKESCLEYFITALEEEPTSDKKKELVAQVVRLVTALGTQTFFNRFEAAFLKDILGDMKLKCDSDSKAKIVLAITLQSNVKKAAPVAKEIEFSEKKLPIKKGITYHDIFQHYYADEIQEWARENGLKVTGSKPVLIRRILAFLDGDKETTLATSKPKPAKKSTTKKSETKPAEEVEEEAEEEEEVEEEEVEEVEEKPLAKKEKGKKSPAKEAPVEEAKKSPKTKEAAPVEAAPKEEAPKKSSKSSKKGKKEGSE